MATKGEHEKPETVDDEHQPSLTPSFWALSFAQDEAAEKSSSPASSPAAEEQQLQPEKREQKHDDKLLKPNTTGSAFGGFSAFSGQNAFAAFTTPADTNGFGAKAADSGLAGFATKASSGGFGDTTPSSSSTSSDAATTGSSGFASFQGKSPVTFASFAAAQPATDGFGAKASSASATDFSGGDVVKKAEPVVPALTEAEKRAKLFKLVEKDYAEVGIGPLRVLNAADAKTDSDKSTARIVMRRESYPHGPGTKLLLNASLGSCLVCEKKTEKTMLLTVLEASEDPEAEKKVVPVTYLMRFGSPDDLDIVMARIQTHMHSSTPSS
ncbi:unnamed protein product [Phytophthora fragariaefolia]|uniref:Unnamed protein product n=1 Tax=Phytophthora fragariaefolia TaxID=1490495 RepID=A0A9W7CJK4_9STRA|nr:unnamed protein product [Phytophthora fragariaefolia]